MDIAGMKYLLLSYLSQEFGQVDIFDGSENQYALILIRVFQLEVSSGSQHGLDGPHPVVVVMLGGEQLGAETVGGDDLARQAASNHEAHGVEGDLGDEGVVGHHHGHSTEQHLKNKQNQIL